MKDLDYIRKLLISSYQLHQLLTGSSSKIYASKSMPSTNSRRGLPIDHRENCTDIKKYANKI